MKLTTSFMFFYILVVQFTSPEFNVALITAGALRSFAVTYRSWERYVLAADNKQIAVKIFAHVLQGNLSCPLEGKGIDYIKRIATAYEVGNFNSSPSGDVLHK